MKIWKDIPGYEGLYQASNEGQIRSLDRTIMYSDGIAHRCKGRVLKLGTHRCGYLNVHLCKNCTERIFYVHRLVWMTFNGEIPEGMEVNHINEDKTDNRLCNLNLMTRKENVNFGTRTERMVKTKSKPVVGMDEQGNVVVTFQSTKEAGRNGYLSGRISDCCNGVRNKHHGLIWRYA